MTGKHEKSPCHPGVHMKARDLLDTVTARRIAVLADADPRSVDRVLLGKPIRGSVRLRILSALAECGLSALAATPNEPSEATLEAPESP